MARESATVADLSDLLHVSTVTIRADLAGLADDGRIVRTHGGARLADGRTRQELSFVTRQDINAAQKSAIGQKAASLIAPVESILLDASSTAVATAQGIKASAQFRELTVVTTGIWTALELMGLSNIHVLLTGGLARGQTGALTGLIAQKALRDLNVSKAFLGAWGITPEGGLTDVHLTEVEIKRCIVERAQTIIAIIDGSKFGRLGLASFAPTSKIDTLITDDSAPPEMVDSLRQQGVEVLVTSSSGHSGNGRIEAGNSGGGQFEASPVTDRTPRDITV